MITTPLLPHQTEGVWEFMKSDGKYAFLWTVGTGKSLAALACADAVNARRILITSDKNNTLNTWPEQVIEHTEIEDHHIFVRPKEKLAVPLKVMNNFVVCCNYDYIQSSLWLRDIPFDMWIGDESGDFKDQRTDRFKYLKHVIANIHYRLILNAEPMTERLEDLFGQFCMLDDGNALGKNLTQYRLRYMQPSPTGYGWVAQRSAFARVRRAVENKSNWIVNRPDLKLPTKVYTTVRVPMSSQQVYHDQQLKEWFSSEIKESKIESNYAPVIFTKRLQLMGGIFHGKKDNEDDIKIIYTNKLDMLVEIIQNNTKSKIVVWHHYVKETDLISHKLKNHNIKNVAFVDPKDPSPLYTFREWEAGVILMRDSMCKGLNQLAGGDICIFYSHPYSYRQRMQAVGRTCRLTSTHKELHVIDMVTEGGVDEIVHHMLTQKKNFSLALSNILQYITAGTNARKDQ
jgi:hypothetical protein